MLNASSSSCIINSGVNGVNSGVNGEKVRNRFRYRTLRVELDVL